MLILYQPQVDEWKYFREVDWRMAVSLTPAGDQPAPGVVELHGRTTVDGNMVVIDGLKIKETHFPGLDEAASAKMDLLLRSFLPSSVTITLQQFTACVPKKDPVPGVQVKSDPPTIFVSESPAVLLDLVPQPVRAPIRDTDLEYVVNTNWRLFFEKSSSIYYLLAGERWLQASKLQGPWSSTTILPKDMQKLPKEERWADLQGFIPPQAAKAGTVVPKVFTSFSPAEVILFDGKPVYAQIPGTGLRHATNTTSYVFYHFSTNTHYYLTAGRWFRAGTLNGPWTFATNDLPADFAHIPGGSPAAQVLASVPGTAEAKDAVLLSQIPTTVAVNPSAAAANVKVTYDGDPQFVPIMGTPLSYGKNTPQKVVRSGDLYCLCFQGVWFVSTSPQGPWQTAQSVPAEIYTIPPSSPLYNVTYVTQAAAPDGTIVCTYTSGYMGVYAMSSTSSSVIVYGTGYYYPAYVGAYPVYGYPAYYPAPYTYGPVTHFTTASGAYGVSQTAYGTYGTATRKSAYNPYTGTYTRSASAATTYGSAAVGQAYNPYTGAYGATKQGSNAYAQWGSSVVAKGGQSAYAQHYSTAQGSVGSVQTSAGGQAVGKTSASGSTAVGKTSGGDVYAGHDGNVYKNTGSGWQKYENGSWSPVQQPVSGSPAQQKSTQQAQNSQEKQQQAMQRERQAESADSFDNPYQRRIEQAEQASRASGAQREAYQQQVQDRAAGSSGRQGGNEQVQRLQQEAQNRQRGAEQNQRSQQYERSRSAENGKGRSGYGGASRGGGRGTR
jgi:hypothetical protein